MSAEASTKIKLISKTLIVEIWKQRNGCILEGFSPNIAAILRQHYVVWQEPKGTEAYGNYCLAHGPWLWLGFVGESFL